METAVKERPILFSEPMVRAIIAGQKTQTRRVVKAGLQPDEWLDRCQYNAKGWAVNNDEGCDCKHGVSCPYGEIGDRLWVREAWSIVPHVTEDGPKNKAKGDGTGVTWRAAWDGNPSGFKWKPSIHMPRWASRINLEIVGVDVERLKDIKDLDAIAEGILQTSDESVTDRTWLDYSGLGVSWTKFPIHSYRTLWESINGSGSWDSNPWVWVIVFKKVSP